MANNTLIQGRVTEVQRSHYTVYSNETYYVATVSGRFSYIVHSNSDYPVVGDYVLMREIEQNKAIIEQVKERSTVLSRLSTKQTNEEQILASNVDIILLCVSLNQDFHRKKIERLLSIASSQNMTPYLILTKSDLAEDITNFTNQLKHLDIPIIPISAYNEDDIENIQSIVQNKTSVCIGASGVGKSTLINKLIDEEHFNTNDVRASDDQGHHTTTHRELMFLEGGGAIIDTPGIRVLTSYIMDDISTRFKQLFDIAEGCKFRDCTHTVEPECAVHEAIYDGIITEEYLEEYNKVLKYNAYLKRRENERNKGYGGEKMYKTRS